MRGILNKKETDKKHLTHREWKLLWDAAQSWKNNTPHSITKKQYVTLMTDLSYSPIEELIKNENFFNVVH